MGIVIAIGAGYTPSSNTRKEPEHTVKENNVIELYLLAWYLVVCYVIHSGQPKRHTQ